MASRGRLRFIFNQRRSQVVSMEQGHEEELRELDLFQSHVADRLLSLLPTSHHGDDANQKLLLSLPFLQKVLGVLLDCEGEFQALLRRNPSPLPKLHLDRAVSDLLDRSVKSLDICNAASHTINSLRHWRRHADIAASVLLPPQSRLPLGPAQINRACRALNKLLAPPNNTAARYHRLESGIGRTERTRSFGVSRTLSWGRSRNCSVPKQVQAMWANLAAPRGGDASLGGGGSGAGLALAVYTMTSVLVFAMWALVAALPCGELGGLAAAIPVAPPRQLAWAGVVVGLQERIVEEWRRREKKGGHPSPGLLAELQGVGRWGQELLETAGNAAYMSAPSDRELVEEVAGRAGELAEACRRLEEGMGPLERKVREVFHRVAGSRSEVLRCLDQSTRSASLSMVL